MEPIDAPMQCMSANPTGVMLKKFWNPDLHATKVTPSNKGQLVFTPQSIQWILNLWPHLPPHSLWRKEMPYELELIGQIQVIE